MPGLLDKTVKNSVFVTAGAVAQFGLSLLFAGLTIRYLGIERAGFFMALQALLGINSLVGGQAFRGAAIQRLASLAGQGDWSACRQVVGTLVTMNAVLGGVLALVLMVSFPWVFPWSKLALTFKEDALWTTVVVALTFFTDQVAGAYRVTYDSRQRFDLVSFNSTVFGFLQNMVRLSVLKLCPTMSAVALGGFVVNLLWLAYDCRLVSNLLSGWVRPSWYWPHLRPMLRLSCWGWLAYTAGFLYDNLDRIVLTSFLGSAALPYYALPHRFALNLHAMLSSQLYFIFPMFAGSAADPKTTIRGVEDRLRWFVSAASCSLFGALALVGPWGMSVLVGSEFAGKATLPLYLACLYGCVHSQQIVYFYSTWAVGSPAPNVVSDAIAAICIIVSACFLIPPLGFIGANVAHLWRLPYIVVHTYWCRRVLGISGTVLSVWRPYMSPILATGAWLAVANLLTLHVPAASVWSAAVGVGSAPIAFLILWLMEERLWPDAARWQTAREAAALLARKFGMRLGSVFKTV